MLDRLFDHYVMGNMKAVVAAYFVDKAIRERPDAGGAVRAETRPERRAAPRL